MKMREKLLEIILKAEEDFSKTGKPVLDIYKYVADAIVDSGFFCNSPDAMDEQEPHVYKWTAVEDDGYIHSEYGVANNMFDAFIKATEYSPDYHKKVTIEKIPDDKLTEDLKKFKEWHIACRQEKN
jgi:hypothetical protein